MKLFAEWNHIRAGAGTTNCIPARSCLPSAAYAVGGGDVCERRLWREKRAKRSGRIKAIDKRALPAQAELLIQQNMSPPHRGFSVDSVRRLF